MTPPLMQVLHVEDDPEQQKVVGHWLNRIEDFRFQIQTATGEAEALQRFQEHPCDLVILDYQLTEGNGLDCLRRLRQLDAFVPVIAISGVAEPSTFTELMRMGAADCLRKDELQTETLAKSIRSAWEWSQAKRHPPSVARFEEFQPLLESLTALCETFASSLPESFFEQLQEFEDQTQGFSVAQRRRLMKFLRKEFSHSPHSAQRLRPLQLELAVRILQSSDPTEQDES